MELGGLCHSAAKTHVKKDGPLVIEELETPKDRCSVVNGAVHYLAGSDSARYPLTYKRSTGDEKFFNCQEYDVKPNTENIPYNLMDSASEGYCASNSDLDMEYVKEICRNGIPRKEASGAQSEFPRTPTKTLRYRQKEPENVSQPISTVPTSAGGASFEQQQRVSAVSLNGNKSTNTYNDYFANPANAHMSGINQGSSYDCSKPAFPQNLPIHHNEFSARQGVSGTTDVFSGTNIDGRLKNITSEPGASMCPNNEDGHKMDYDCKSLLSFAREFREKYGGLSFGDAETSNRFNATGIGDRNPGQWKPTGFKSRSWDSTTAGTDCLPQPADFSSKSFLGTYPGQRSSGLNACCYENDGNQRFINSLKERNPIVEPIAGRGPSYMHVQSSDILLRDYVASGANDPARKSNTVPEFSDFMQQKPRKSEGRVPSNIEGSATKAQKQDFMPDARNVISDEVRYSTQPAGHGNDRNINVGLTPSVRSGQAYNHSSWNFDHQSQVATGTFDKVGESRTNEALRTDKSSHIPSKHWSANPVTINTVNQQIDDFFKSRRAPDRREQASVSCVLPKATPITSPHVAFSTQPFFNEQGHRNVSLPEDAVVINPYRGPVSYFQSPVVHCDKPFPKHHVVEPSTTKVDAEVQTVASHMEELSISKSYSMDRRNEHIPTRVFTNPENLSSWSSGGHTKPVDFPSIQGNSTSVVDAILETKHGMGRNSGDFEDMYNLGFIDNKKSGDVNLYDSSRIDYHQLPIIEETTKRASVNEKMVQFDGIVETPTMLRLDTVHEETPYTKEYANSDPTIKNHLEHLDNHHIATEASMISFGDEVASYVPGKHIAEMGDQFSTEDLFSDVGTSERNRSSKARSLNSFSSCRNRSDILGNSDTNGESSEGAYFHSVENAPRNLGYKKLGSANSYAPIIQNNCPPDFMRDDFEHLIPQGVKETGCHCCHDHVPANPIRDSCCSHIGQNASLGRIHNKCCHKGHFSSCRTASQVSQCHCQSVNYSVPVSERVVLPVSSFRGARPDFPPLKNAVRSGDIFSETSSDYVRVPSETMSCMDGECEKECEFSGSEATEEKDSIPPLKLSKSLLNPIEKMLSEELQSTNSFESFVSLVKRLYETLEGNNQLNSDKSIEIKQVDHKSNNGGSTGVRHSSRGNMNARSPGRGSVLDSTRTSSLTSRMKTFSEDSKEFNGASERMASYLSRRRAPLPTRVEAAPSVDEQPGGFHPNYKWLKEAIAEVRHSKATGREVIYSESEQEEENAPLPELTKEALVSRMVSGESDFKRSQAVSKDIRPTKESGPTNQPKKPQTALQELPDGLTQEYLLDVYNEVTKLSKIFHVKDIKSLTRAVTARVNNRNI